VARRSTRELLSSATHLAVRADYWLDHGVRGIEEVAGLLQTRDAHLALHKNKISVPTEVHQFDALKPFRAAAFAGFAIGLE
jgi:hypothetical protein